MKSASKVLVFILLLCVYGCWSKVNNLVSVATNGNNIYVLSLDNLKSETKTVSLSDLVEYCVFVQLEFNLDAYVEPWTITVTDRYIGIKQRKREPYKLFDRSGSFISNVGSFGRGPGEFSVPIWEDIIDDENELIYLMPHIGNKIFVYSTSGQFLKEIVSPHQLRLPSMFLYDNILAVVHLPLNDEALVLQFDVNTGEVLKKFTPPANLILEGLSDDAIFSTRNSSDIFDIFSSKSDTLYHFDLINNQLLPFFTARYNSSENIWKQYFMLNKDLLFTRIHCWENSGFCKKEGLVAIDLIHKTSSFVEIVNDYYGNLPVPIIFYELRNGYLTHSFQPEGLIEEIENRLAKSSCTENDRHILSELLSKLDEDANNVVFVAKLKTDIEKRLF